MTRTPEKIVYTASATTTGGRQGHAVSSDGVLDLDPDRPKEMGGTGDGHQPRAALRRRLLRLLQQRPDDASASRARVDATAAQVTRRHRLRAGRARATACTVDLEVALPGLERPAPELIDAAHQVCPYSNAIAGNVPTTVAAVAAA